MDLSLIHLWALQLARWLHHVFRHASSPQFRLLHCQSPEWLRHARALSGAMLSYRDGVNAGETRTPGESGNVVRWAGRWVEAIGKTLPLTNEARDSGLTRQLASAILAILEHGRWQGERVLVI